MIGAIGEAKTKSQGRDGPLPKIDHSGETPMQLEILLPFGVFAEEKRVSRIVVETRAGSFGLLPRRLDCVAALAPGILIYERDSQGEVYVAVDEGVLIKTGTQVRVSVRQALGGHGPPPTARRRGAAIRHAGRTGKERARSHGEARDRILASLRELSAWMTKTKRSHGKGVPSLAEQVGDESRSAS